MQSNKSIDLCIPKVSIHISRTQIFKIFCQLNIGYISKIIENPLRKDSNYKRVVICVHWDNTQTVAKEMQEILKDPTEHVNLVYNMPWYWQIYANQPRKYKIDAVAHQTSTQAKDVICREIETKRGEPGTSTV